MNKRYLGVIPARGGSKGIPKKNIKVMNGKPLIYYTIEASNRALNKGALAKCIVSTDSDEVASISEMYGADVPFIRPAFLSGDTVKSVDVIIHALSFLEQKGEQYDAVVTLQPTSPLRTEEDLIGGIELFDMNTRDSAIAVYEDNKANGYNYYRMGLDQVGIAEHAEHNTGIRRQDMKPMYVRNGALYISSTKLLKERHLIIGDYPLLYVMPKQRSIDVDSPQDFEYVEFLMKKST